MQVNTTLSPSCTVWGWMDRVTVGGSAGRADGAVTGAGTGSAWQRERGQRKNPPAQRCLHRPLPTLPPRAWPVVWEIPKALMLGVGNQHPCLQHPCLVWVLTVSAQHSFSVWMLAVGTQHPLLVWVLAVGAGPWQGRAFPQQPLEVGVHHETQTGLPPPAGWNWVNPPRGRSPSAGTQLQTRGWGPPRHPGTPRACFQFPAPAAPLCHLSLPSSCHRHAGLVPSAPSTDSR